MKLSTPKLIKCSKCAKSFLFQQKSDVLNIFNFICPQCKGEKDLIYESIFSVLKGIYIKFK